MTEERKVWSYKLTRVGLGYVEWGLGYVELKFRSPFGFSGIVIRRGVLRRAFQEFSISS